MLGSVGLLVLFGVVVVVLDRQQIVEVVRQADWHLAPLALPFVALSYFLVGYSFFLINRIFGSKLGLWDLVETGYVTNALDNLLPGLGLPGMSLRVLILKRRGLDTDRAVSVSLFRSYFNNLLFFAFLPVALIYLLLTHLGQGAQAIGIVVLIVIVIVFILAGIAAGFIPSFRHLVLNIVSRLVRFVARRDIRPSLEKFDDTFEYGIRAIRSNLKVLVFPIMVIVGAWLCTVATLWFGFNALGNPLDFGVVFTGFIIGRAAGVISFLPGGLGTQDASTVGVLVSYGVPLAQATLADILFRVIYYFIPFILSLGLYRRLLRK